MDSRRSSITHLHFLALIVDRVLYSGADSVLVDVILTLGLLFKKWNAQIESDFPRSDLDLPSSSTSSAQDVFGALEGIEAIGMRRR